MKIEEKLKPLIPIDNNKAPSYLKLWWKYNEAMNRVEMLTTYLKDKTFEKALEIVLEPERIKSLTNEVKSLRERLRTCRRIMKEDHERLMASKLKIKMVYICSPLAGDIKGNIEKAKTYCKRATDEGYIPIAPHVYLTQVLDDTKSEDRQKGLEYGMELLKLCDIMWVFGTKESEGMKKEIEWWKENTDKEIVFYHTNGRMRNKI